MWSSISRSDRATSRFSRNLSVVTRSKSCCGLKCRKVEDSSVSNNNCLVVRSRTSWCWKCWSRYREESQTEDSEGRLDRSGSEEMCVTIREGCEVFNVSASYASTFATFPTPSFNISHNCDQTCLYLSMHTSQLLASIHVVGSNSEQIITSTNTLE